MGGRSMTNTSRSTGKPRRTFTSVGSVEASQALVALGIPYVQGDWEVHDLRSGDLPIEAELRPGPWHEDYVLAFGSLAEAREALPLLTDEGVAKNLAIILPSLSASAEASSQRSPNVLGSQALTVNLTGRSQRYSATQIKGTSWTKIHSFVQSVVGYAPNDLRQLPFNGLRLGVGDFESSVWSVGDSLARRIDLSIDQFDVQVVDSVDLVAQGIAVPRRIAQRQELPAGPGAQPLALPPVDPMIFSPRGFDPYPDGGLAEIVVSTPETWTLQSDGKAIGSPFIGLNEHVLNDLRQFRQVDVSEMASGHSWGVSRILSQLAASGVPLKTGLLNGAVHDLLGNTLGAMLENSEIQGATASERESFSIEIRRAALRQFLPRLRLGSLGLSRNRRPFDWPSVSVILSTRRPGLIPLILQQISRQSYSNLEVVLAVHGNAQLSLASDAAISEFPGRIRHLSFTESVPFGEVLNEACAAADGQVVTKMDDDDWYSEFHIEDLVLAREYSGAQLVGSPVEFTYLEGLDITTRRGQNGERYTNHVAGGTMMISRADLRAVGGWRIVSNAVDRGLIDAVLASGGNIYRTHGQNYVMHRRTPKSASGRHTWDADYSVFLRDIREKWDGLVLPPLFTVNDIDQIRHKRDDEYRSVFSDVDDIDHGAEI